MSEGYIVYIICSILSFIPAMVVHEVAHGFVAFKLGDTTAKRSGRLSLNPIKHIDPFGTIILPLLMLATNGPIFGYAKPVPVNPSYFKNPKVGDALCGLAGPAANLVMALIGAGVAWALYPLLPEMYDNTFFMYFYIYFLRIFVLVNLFLMFFNLLPIPPLDGSSVLALVIPDKYLPQYYRLQHYAFPVFLIVMIAFPYFFNFAPFSWYLSVTAGNLANLIFPFEIY